LALRVEVVVVAAPVVVFGVPSEAVRALLSTLVAGLLAGVVVEAVVERTGSLTHFILSTEHKGERTTEREIPLNDFMCEGAGAQAEVKNLIDRMFDGA
jgi:uncharacterized membrane protein YraQ (UPF0718 family)